jgi:hypothetical protein
MRRALVLLAVCAGLAVLFATASHSPRPTVRVTTALVAINVTSCSLTPLGITCATHAQAERLRAQFAKYQLSVPVSGKTVALPAPIPTPPLAPAGVP